MIRKSYLGAMMLALATFAGQATHANVIIAGLDINGTLFDVTFHAEPATFSSLWGDDPNFATWNGTLARAPYFWMDQAGATQAGEAIIAALGTSGVTSSTVVTDGFWIPFFGAGGTVLYIEDAETVLFLDGVNQAFTTQGDLDPARPWVQFEEAIGSVDAPFTPSLLLVGLAAAGLVRRAHTRSH